MEEEDIFHSVVMTEESCYKSGYDEGAEEGEKRGYEEGFSLGIEKGTEIGREVGFYYGYASQVLKRSTSETTKARVTKVCESILALRDCFKDIHPTEDALTENLDKMRSKFKQLTSLLGVQVDFNTQAVSASGSSF